MAFRITPSHASRTHKPSKCIAAFDDDDDGSEEEGLKAVEAPTTLPEPPPGSTPATAVTAAQWVERGSTFAEQGDTSAALKCWDQALLVDPGDGRVHEMRAQVLNAAGRTYEAIQAAQQAVSLQPHWAEAHITLARVQLNFGEPILALRSYQAAAKLQPQHPDLEAELPTAQMYAKLHTQQQQQQPGSRAHVVGQGTSAARPTPGPHRHSEGADAHRHNDAADAGAAEADCTADDSS